MIYPEVSPEQWSKITGIELKSAPCSKCKKEFPCNIPIAIKGYRGFTTKPHECGDKYVRSVWIPWDSKEVEFWMKFKHGILEC